MNPLSPLTYYRRHRGRGLLMMCLISLATLGVCITVRLPDALAEQFEAVVRYEVRFSIVSPMGSSLEPGVATQIRTHPGVAQVIPEKSLYIHVPLETAGGFRLFGVPESEISSLMDACDLRLKEGRLFKARTNEIVLSEQLADALELQVGDPIGRPIDERYYGNIPTTMSLVGILETDPAVTSKRGVIVGFLSVEYMESHQAYMSMPSGAIVLSHTGRKEEVDGFLEDTIASPLTGVATYRRDMELMARGMLLFRVLFGVVDCVAAAVIAVVVGTINQIGLAQRLQELGLLHAIGHDRRRLLSRVVAEAAAVAGVGWFAGLGLSWSLLAWLKFGILPPTMGLDLWNLTPIWFALPILLAVIAFVAFSTMRTLWRLDAIAIIERGKISAEADGRQWVAGGSSPRPLSSWTFYLRHKQRGVALIVAIGLMILGVVFPALLLAPMLDAAWLLRTYLHYVSAVYPQIGNSLDPGVVGQLRSHAAVARVIPAVQLGLMVDMPPANQNPARVFGVSEEDAQALLDVYGAQLIEGRLPRPRTNEIALSQSIVVNRGLRLGDKVGRPVHEYDYSIPTELVLVGVLGRVTHDGRERDMWTGFTSYEYLRSHELYRSRPDELLLVPREGRKAELDAWLEGQVTSERTGVRTYKLMLKRRRLDMLAMFLLCAMPESIVALVAAVALAVLSYTFYRQRQEEYGTLHAIGHGRRWLVRRTMGETVTVVALAWLLGAALCGAGLAYIQIGLYAPKGLTLDFFNPVPWLLTLPMPLAVITVGTGLVARMLSKLDPVAIIERR